MPVAFLRPFGQGGFAPVARPRFILGSDLDCDLVDGSDNVAAHHATVKLRRGEYVLVAENGCSLWVDGERVPLMSLRNGDTVALAEGAMPWLFRSRIDGSFWPPSVTLGEAWLAHPSFSDPASGPGRFSKGRALTRRSLMVLGPYSPLVIKQLGPIRDPPDATRFLRLIAALGGVTHPALAPVVDGGVAPDDDGEPVRWLATRFVDGVWAAHLLQVGALSLPRVVRILRSIAEGLAVLHHRGVVHGNVCVENIVVPPTNRAVLIDYGTARSLENPEPATGDAHLAGKAVHEPPVDVYGLAAVGKALLGPEWRAPDEPGVAAEFGGLIESSLQFEAAVQPTALELAEALRALEARA